ncbi:MAG: DUF2786 domain-containing protein [Planctomycetota bacterium]
MIEPLGVSPPGGSTPDGRAGEDRRKLLRLIKELQALSAGTDSPAEAASAAAKAQSLLLKHNLSIAEVDGFANAEDDPLVEQRESLVAGRRRIDRWRQMLVHAVADSCLCQWITNSAVEPGDRKVSFIGRRSNVEVAVYSFRCLERQIVGLGELEKRRRRQKGLSVRRNLSHFYEGVVDTIRRRLAADREQFERATPRAHALVQARDHEAEHHLKHLYPHVRFFTRSFRVDAQAHADGQRAGESVRLHHALGDDAAPRRLLS